MLKISLLSFEIVHFIWIWCLRCLFYIDLGKLNCVHSISFNINLIQKVRSHFNLDECFFSINMHEFSYRFDIVWCVSSSQKQHQIDTFFQKTRKEIACAFIYNTHKLCTFARMKSGSSMSDHKRRWINVINNNREAVCVFFGLLRKKIEPFSNVFVYVYNCVSMLHGWMLYPKNRPFLSVFVFALFLI